MLPVRFDEVEGKRVRYFRGGEGPPIVFLHGYPDNLQMWSAVAPLLEGFETVAFDWPGMGGSEAWAGGATPFPVLGTFLKTVREVERLAARDQKLGDEHGGARPARPRPGEEPQI